MYSNSCACAVENLNYTVLHHNHHDMNGIKSYLLCVGVGSQTSSSSFQVQKLGEVEAVFVEVEADPRLIGDQGTPLILILSLVLKQNCKQTLKSFVVVFHTVTERIPKL